jgi:hypothetical protein
MCVDITTAAATRPSLWGSLTAPVFGPQVGLVADYTIASGTNPRAARERAVALLREYPALVEDLLLRHVLEGQFPQRLPATVTTVEGEALQVVTASDGRQTIDSQVSVWGAGLSAGVGLLLVGASITQVKWT